MEKIYQNKILVLVIIIILIAFYWFAVRPTSIKKNCFWFTEVIPVDLGVTKEQAEINKKELESRIAGKYNSEFVPIDRFTLSKNSVERLPQPEKEVIREATKDEYSACLRQNGL